MKKKIILPIVTIASATTALPFIASCGCTPPHQVDKIELDNETTKANSDNVASISFTLDGSNYSASDFTISTDYWYMDTTNEGLVKKENISVNGNKLVINLGIYYPILNTYDFDLTFKTNSWEKKIEHIKVEIYQKTDITNWYSKLFDYQLKFREIFSDTTTRPDKVTLSANSHYNNLQIATSQIDYKEDKLVYLVDKAAILTFTTTPASTTSEPLLGGTPPYNKYEKFNKLKEKFTTPSTTYTINEDESLTFELKDDGVLKYKETINKDGFTTYLFNEAFESYVAQLFEITYSHES